MDERQEIIENYNILKLNINKLQYLSMFLKWIIDNVIDYDIDSDEFIYVYRKVEQISLLYGIQSDVIHRFKKDVNSMITNLEIDKELNLSKYLEENNKEIIDIHKTKSA